MDHEQESLTVRQENEFEALQSIYAGFIVDLRKNDVWQVRRPPEMLISLRPQQSNSMTVAHALIDLHIKCPALYPNVIPEISLQNPKGLSNKNINILQEQLVELAKKLIGEEMIYELCSHVESFLHDNNKPPAPSFYDEMITNQKRLQEQKALENERIQEIQRKTEELQFQKLEEQIKRKDMERKENARKMRENAQSDRRSISDTNATPLSTSPQTMAMPDCGEVVKATESRQLQHPDERSILMKFTSDRERTIHRGKCIDMSSRDSRVFVGMDADTGALVSVTQWEIPWSSDKYRGKEAIHRARMKNLISTITKELKTLLPLSHSNLVRYLGINHEMVELLHVKINVLSEYVGGGNMQARVHSRRPVPMAQLHGYIHQTLQGLDYLHSNSIVHGDLQLSSLLLDSSGKVKIADYCIQKRIINFMQEGFTLKTAGGEGGGGGGGGGKPALNPSVQEKSKSKMDDLSQLGFLSLSMALGSVMTDVPNGFPSSIPMEFIDFIRHCTEPDDSTTTSLLLEHPFIKSSILAELKANRSYDKSSFTSAARTRQVSCRTIDCEDADDELDNLLLLQSISSTSRLKTEFKILQRIGKGGFGDVIKVRNLLDNRCYAIKRIALNPGCHKKYKKITREVEVLSKLNHENIVRYFNSWLEICEEMTSASSTSQNSNSNCSAISEDELSETASIESVIRRRSGSHPVVEEPSSLEPSSLVPRNSSSNGEDSSYDSSNSIDSDADVFGHTSQWSMSSDSESDSIVFETDDKETAAEPSTQVVSQYPKNNQVQTRDKRKGRSKQRQYLFIQMEFCEKSTLRDCIDTKNLYKDVNRVWELFREIVEGLAHMHDQGIIHRDLKPMNIFLDSEYHVKIGDFGLATAFMEIIAESTAETASKKVKKSPCDEESSLTGKVGTALYVSPEMETNAKRYNMKVDIYSLGIIFFEMCYRPLSTGMERVKVLSDIRKPTIDFPADFNEICSPSQANIISLLLNHDPFKRPTAKELLKNDNLPLSQMEELELYEMLNCTISNSEGRTYKHMLQRIFMQPVDQANDFLYDADLLKGFPCQQSFTSLALVQRTVTSALERIFQRHGAIRMLVPLLMPVSSLYNDCDMYVAMMERSGGLVSLPYDSMVPFARFIARSKTSQSNFKRYSIDRVYRECRPSGVHPRELWAASFDIVRSSTSNLDDAEVIYVACEIIREFPALNSLNYRLRINHTLLLKAILLHCGVPEEKHSRVSSILGDNSIDRQSKIQKQALLSDESLSENCIKKIFSFIHKEDCFENISSFLKSISVTKTQAASLVKKGLQEIEFIIESLTVLECKPEPLVSLSLVSNIQLYSGMLFQVVHVVQEEKQKKKQSLGVLAAGGRYDNLVATFRKPTEKQSGCPHVVGFSIAFDKVLNATLENGSLPQNPLIEVLICGKGQAASAKRERLIAARRLWEVGLAADVYQESCEDLDDVKIYCHHMRIPYLVMSSGSDSKVSYTLHKLQLHTVEKSRVLKRDVALDLIVEMLLLHKMENLDTNKFQTSTVQTPTDTNVSFPGLNVGGGGGGGNVALPSYSITFIMQESEKVIQKTRRAYESQIGNSIAETLRYLCSKYRIEVLATELSGNLIKAIASHFEINKDEASIVANIGVKDGQKANSKKYVLKVIGEIKEMKSKHKNLPILPIILYSLPDDIHRLMLC